MSPDNIPILIAEADAGAKRLVRKLRLARHEHDDIRQNLLLDLITRMPGYAPQRGTLGAFAGIVIRHRAGRLARQILQDRARPSICLEEITSRAEALPQELSYDPFGGVELRLGLRRALQRLDPTDLGLCSELLDQPPSEIERDTPGSRATLYRHIREIRLRLMLDGVSAQG
jgi:RNA polymerase sigma-70 factor (ECF subfamily)